MNNIEKQQDFQLHVPEVGRFGGGTQAPVYLDKKGNKTPYKKTKWYQLKKKKEWLAKTF